jgi:adenosylhomocysteine nucleosidase
MPAHKVAIVAALEREIWPLVKDWPVQRREYDGRWFKFFEKDSMVLVCGGIGSEAARRSAEAIISLYQPSLLISAGFAGGLDPALQAGHTMIARQVIDARDSSRIDSGMGEGVLVTFESVADTEQKAKLATAFGAHAVDMEAAAVARSAEAHGVKFFACKVISDASDSRALPIGRFITSDGGFHAVRFLLHVAVRPWLWVGVQKLARDSKLAARELCQALMSTEDSMRTLGSGFHAQPESKA